MLKSIRAWFTTRKTYNTLDHLSDHLLEDVGIHRGQISRIARGIDLTPCAKKGKTND